MTSLRLRLLSTWMIVAAIVAIGAACDGDVFPIQEGTVSEPMSPGGDTGGDEPTGSSGGSTSPGGSPSSGGAVEPTGGMGGVTEPGRLVPVWNEPVKLPISVPGESDSDPSMSPNGLELYFTSTRTGGVGKIDIFRATRSTVDDEWSTPTPIDELNSAQDEAGPFVSSDGLTIWLARHNGMTFSLFQATRSTINDNWEPPTSVPGLGGTRMVWRPR